MKLTGNLVDLRDVTMDDVAAIVGDDRVTETLSFDSRDREATQAMLAGIVERATHVPRVEYYLGVTKHGEDKVIGFARLGLGGVKAAKLGIVMAADHWRKGYALDACMTIVRFGFADVGLHRITAAVGPDNAASLALVERSGFSYEGRLRDHVFTNSAWRDSLLYSLLEDELLTDR